MVKLTVAHLFDGIGGFHIASDRASMETLWVSEIDQHASAVTDHHWPHVKNLGDIHGITNAPAVDVLTGGFPCQDYPVAGTRGGLAGDRGALWWQYLRLIAECRPTWVVGENVPGLLSSNDGRDFETIVRSLTECGYGVVWTVLDAQYFGVAQRRRRVFIVGHSGGEPRPEILALSEGVFGHPEPSRETGEETAPTLAARTRGGGWPGTDEALDGAVIRSHPRPGSATVGAIAATLTQGAPSAGRRNEDDINLVAQGVVSKGNGEAFLTGERVTSLGQGGGQAGQGYPAGLVDGAVRRLTPLECERLQGFPDGWTNIPGNSGTQRYRQLGNAVAVPVAEWIMRRVADAS